MAGTQGKARRNSNCTEELAARGCQKCFKGLKKKKKKPAEETKSSLRNDEAVFFPCLLKHRDLIKLVKKKKKEIQIKKHPECVQLYPLSLLMSQLDLEVL